MTEKKLILQTPRDMTNWGNPQVLAPGAKDILLFGNPGQSENYVFRFKLPKDFEIKPFMVNPSCFLTVIEGEVLIGEGDVMSLLPAQSVCYIPEKYPIYFFSNEQVILQFHGTGPINMEYVNPVDDPRNG